VFLVIGLLIKFFGRSKIFFTHERIGINGNTFKCIKFQTMHSNSKQILEELLQNDKNAKAQWQKDFKLKNDPRVTAIGKFLRKTSLDELPQLLNVLKGEMSLVGPRPIIDQEIERYGYDYYYYKLVRPGITGIWQISGRSDIDYSNRVRLDVWYVKNWSLWYDFVIMLQTIGAVIKRKGAY
jgi:Undecaprenyl-phosphate galactose phosphotransferase WbaP